MQQCGISPVFTRAFQLYIYNKVDTPQIKTIEVLLCPKEWNAAARIKEIIFKNRNIRGWIRKLFNLLTFRVQRFSSIATLQMDPKIIDIFPRSALNLLLTGTCVKVFSYQANSVVLKYNALIIRIHELHAVHTKSVSTSPWSFFDKRI